MGRRKALRAIRRMGSAEHRRVDAELHAISRALVDRARSIGAVIAIGDLSGIRENKRGRGRRMSRIVNAMPFNRLSQLIGYKAAWAGVPYTPTVVNNSPELPVALNRLARLFRRCAAPALASDQRLFEALHGRRIDAARRASRAWAERSRR